MPALQNEDTVFFTSALLTIHECVKPTIRITNPSFKPDLRDGEFLVILNPYKEQSRVFDALTRGMKDRDACKYVRRQTNRALVRAARAGSIQLSIQHGPHGEAIPAVRIDRVRIFREESGRRRFVGIGVGTMASI